MHDPDGAPWEVYTVLADAPDETDLGCSADDCCTTSEQVALSAASPSTRCC